MKHLFVGFIFLLMSATAYSQVTLINTGYLKKKNSKLIRKGSAGKSGSIKLISTKKKAKKVVKKKRTIAKKKSKKKAKKKKAAKKSKKSRMNSMKTCAIYKPKGKDATIVVEATNEKRGVPRRKKCRSYRKTNKKGKSVLVIEIDESKF